MRRSLIFYRNEIQKMTGKVHRGHGGGGGGVEPGVWASGAWAHAAHSPTQDPLEQFGISEEARFQLGGLKA